MVRSVRHIYPVLSSHPANHSPGFPVWRNGNAFVSLPRVIGLRVLASLPQAIHAPTCLQKSSGSILFQGLARLFIFLTDLDFRPETMAHASAFHPRGLPIFDSPVRLNEFVKITLLPIRTLPIGVSVKVTDASFQ